MNREENQITLLVADDGPYLTLAALAEGARRLLKEEFLVQAHPNSQTWLHDQAWWQVYVEVTFQRFRLIPVRPRQVETCDEFLQEVADIADVPHLKDAVRAVIQMIERGDDLSALLSKRATEPKQGRGDAFLADWHLHHLHIYEESGELMFAHFDDRTARLIAIRPHASWAEYELVRRIRRRWPGLIFSESLTDLRPVAIPTDTGLKALQQAGVLVALPCEDGGSVMSPGQTASGHPIPIIDCANHVALTLLSLYRGDIRGVTDPRDWTPCLNEDLTELGLWNAERQATIWLARLWPFRGNAEIRASPRLTNDHRADG